MTSLNPGSAQSPSVTGQPPLCALDLTQCDREPVQFPGAIMPHGYLLLVSGGDHRLLGASSNIRALFGSPVEDLLNQPLEDVFHSSAHQTLARGLERINTSGPPRYLGCVSAPKSWEPLDAFAHRMGDHLIIELEALDTEPVGTVLTERFADVMRCAEALQSAATWEAGLESVVRDIRRLSGFDSVMGVRFVPDGSFQVIAEARGEVFPAFLDKRFPRSDIPDPGRRQMLLMPTQYAPDLDYAPVPLIMAPGLSGATDIDLGFSLLRSISRMCNRFYLNVGVRSRLVLTLIDQGELWGFISCWHGSAKRVSYADRLAYQNLAQVASLSLVEKEKAGRFRRTLEAKRRMDTIAQGLSSDAPDPMGVDGIPNALLESLDVDGAALCLGHRIIRAGNTPDVAVIQDMLHWLDEQPAFYQTDSLAADCETARESAVTGLLAARLMEPGQYMLAFRPEWVHEVKWAGDPRKPVEQIPGAAPGEFRLTARGSFEEWKQVVKGHSRPWEDTECEAMKDLQTAITLWQQAQKLQALMISLEDSNEELKNFAYTVSHDLQEPLRGINNFGQFLDDSVGPALEARERKWLNGIRKLSLRMSQQIEALLSFSRASQQALNQRPLDLGQILTQVLETLADRISETGTDIIAPKSWPAFRGDPERIRVVLENLIANAIKYNEQSQPRIEIGLVDGPVPAIFVQDNGIGIAENHREVIFDVFRRLHGREEYGGGTGAGLAIARKHIERHGGRLWVEAAPGGGSRFLFTLAGDPASLTLQPAPQ